MKIIRNNYYVNVLNIYNVSIFYFILRSYFTGIVSQQCLQCICNVSMSEQKKVIA